MLEYAIDLTTCLTAQLQHRHGNQPEGKYKRSHTLQDLLILILQVDTVV